jgi:hypothetical protein
LAWQFQRHLGRLSSGLRGIYLYLSNMTGFLTHRCVFHVLTNLFFNLVIDSFILFKIFYLVLDSLITFQFNPEFHPTQT